MNDARSLFGLSLAAAAALCPLPAQEPTATPLRIAKIVLYKHGVGYFERRGEVQGDAVVRLTFKADEMKDVLKSLFAVDLGGGRISTILYDSKDPIEKQLEEIRFRVPQNQALSQFLMQVQGCRVRVSIGARQLEGRVLGIEPKEEHTQAGKVTRLQLVLLTEQEGIVNVDLLESRGLHVLDEGVRKGLSRMMEILAKARYADRKTVTLRALGKGERTLRVGYIIPTPIWKTSYRLLLEKDRPPLLQGWAIVENRTDEDWENVQLSMVAGSPLSFVLDLYTSYYPPRPVLEMQLAAAASGLPTAGKRPSRRQVMARLRGFAVRDRSGAEKKAAADAAPAEELEEMALDKLVERSLEAAARGVEVGELFAYEAKGPVSIRQGQAALVPILLERVESARRVLYYRRDRSEHPAHAVWLTNSTELTLEKGPVTVFEAGTCLGEAMLTRTLDPGMKEILPYALEPGVQVRPEVAVDSAPAHRARLSRGILTLVHTEVRETRYALRNETGQVRALVIDHPQAGPGYRLVHPNDPVERVRGHLRFEVELPAGAEKTLSVREERPVQTQVMLANQGTDRIRFYLAQPYLSEQAKQILAQVVELMERRAELDRRLADARAERQRLVRDQETIRKNVQILRDSPEERRLREQLVQRITKAMARMDELDASIAKTTEERTALDARIRETLARFEE